MGLSPNARDLQRLSRGTSIYFSGPGGPVSGRWVIASIPSDPRRQIPAVHVLWQEEELQRLLLSWPRVLVQEATEAVLAEVRQTAAAGVPPISVLIHRVRERTEELARPSLRPVINATGVVLHTNLGRAPLAEAARRAMAAAAAYGNLEFDLDSGRRGSRYVHMVELLKRLTGAEAAMVVNNNAAGVFLALRSLAAGREVVISRGELVEIGGSFRVPEVMVESGARLREVGTTNKTRIGDYEAALNPETALILRVHQSNFRQIGFTASASRAELVELGRRQGLPVMEDLGSGVLVDLTTRGLPPEPTVQESLQEGIDLVTFSGDKLLGGPQAGLIVGRADLIERMRQHPLTRALRVDKATLAGLSATLALYLDPEIAWREIPTLRLLSLSREELGQRSAELRDRLRPLLPSAVVALVEPDFSAVGGGSLPAYQLPSAVLALSHPDRSPLELQAQLRHARLPVVTRVGRERLIVDLRTVFPEEEEQLLHALGLVLSA